MTPDEHLEQHKTLHAALDALATDWAAHHPDKRLVDISAMDLIRWSDQQSRKPTAPGDVLTTRSRADMNLRNPSVTDWDYETGQQLMQMAMQTERSITLYLTPFEAFSVVANLQLACRHQDNTGAAREHAELVARRLEPWVAATDNLATLLEMGWGSQPAPEAEAARMDLGPCCACERHDRTVRNILMLPIKTTIPGTGWGCFACDLPPDGATAIVCDECLATKQQIRFAMLGEPAKGERIPIEELVGEHVHDPARHSHEQ